MLVLFCFVVCLCSFGSVLGGFVFYCVGVQGWEFLNSGWQGLIPWLHMEVLPTLGGPILSGMDESVGRRALHFP